MRWKTVRCSTSSAIAGITWTAEAPVPITATRLPRRSCAWSQRAVCIVDAGEVVDARDVGRLGLREHAGGVDHVARDDLLAVRVASRQTRASSSNVAASIRDAEPRLVAQPVLVGAVLRVGAQLGAGRVDARPVRAPLERELVAERRDVDGEPG